MTQQEPAAEVFERMAEDQDIQAKINEATKLLEAVTTGLETNIEITAMHLNYMLSVIGIYKERIKSLSKQLYDLSVQPDTACPECDEYCMDELDGVYGCAACGYTPEAQTARGGAE